MKIAMMVKTGAAVLFATVALSAAPAHAQYPGGDCDGGYNTGYNGRCYNTGYPPGCYNTGYNGGYDGGCYNGGYNTGYNGGCYTGVYKPGCFGGGFGDDRYESRCEERREERCEGYGQRRPF